MADDRVVSFRENYNAEAEEHLFGIINGDITYEPAEEDEEEDISSYLNLDGEGEGTDTVDGGQPSTNNDGDMQVATTSGEVYIYIEPLVIQTY